MNGLYMPNKQYSAEDFQRLTDVSNQHNGMMGLMNTNGSNSMMGGQMDGLMQDNEKDLQRRRSFPHPHSYGSSRSYQDADPRRTSMMEFGSPADNALDGFQFNPGSLPADTGMQRPGNIAQRRLESQRARRHMSHENLNLNTSYSSVPHYNALSASSPYGQPMNSADPLSGFDLSNDYMMMGMNYTPTQM